MEYINLEGLDKKVSRIGLGSIVMSPHRKKESFKLLDGFAEAGGTLLDTALIYGDGQSEKAIGLWLKERGNRGDVVIIDKGCHPNAKEPVRVNPKALRKDLAITLDSLQTDHIDLYLLHRDDPSVPIGELLGALEEQRQAGRITMFGCSNWTIPRIQEAMEYAAKNKIQGFSLNSPNFSLAVPLEPVWPGCLSLSREDCKWHTQTGLLVAAWSSQARGFFSGRFEPDKRHDADMVRTYYNDENFGRLDRARALAKKKGCSPTQIALAFVLNQPFPCISLVGPENPEELKDSVAAIEIFLSDAELNYLDSGNI